MRLRLNHLSKSKPFGFGIWWGLLINPLSKWLDLLGFLCKLDKLKIFSGKFKAILNGSQFDLSNTTEVKKSVISKTQSDTMYNNFVAYIIIYLMCSYSIS